MANSGNRNQTNVSPRVNRQEVAMPRLRQGMPPRKECCFHPELRSHQPLSLLSSEPQGVNPITDSHKSAGLRSIRMINGPEARTHVWRAPIPESGPSATRVSRQTSMVFLTPSLIRNLYFGTDQLLVGTAYWLPSKQG